MEPSFPFVMSVFFLATGVSAVLSMLVLQGRSVAGARTGRLRWIHRVSGYLFILLFAGLLVEMLDRLSLVRAGGPLPILHVALAVILAPMLLVKAGIARWFKRLFPHLVSLGLGIFFLAVLLVGLPVLVPHANPPGDVQATAAVSSAAVKAEADLHALLKDRCARCHTLDKVHEKDMDLPEWRTTIARMQGYVEEPQFLTIEEADRLARYLAGGKIPRE